MNILILILSLPTPTHTPEITYYNNTLVDHQKLFNQVKYTSQQRPLYLL